MAEETYTEVTRQSWGSRLKGSFKGILLGFVLVGAGLYLLFWNEGRAVRRTRALDQGSGAVVSVAADRVEPANDGQLVHLTGMAETSEVLSDPEFGIAVQAIHLRRNVEMYQWRESSTSTTEKKVGGSTETTTTYSYEKVWFDRAIQSSSFKKPAGHENPGSMPFSKREVSASRVTVGAFGLSPGLIGRMSRWEPLAVSGTSLLPEELRWKASLSDGGFYFGFDPMSPEIGDLKVSFELVKPGTVSIVARQGGSALGPWSARNGQTVELLRSGAAGPEAMFEAAHRSNKLNTWILRLLGFVLILWGLRAILRLLSVLADVIPAVGNLVEGGTKLFTLFLGGFMALCTMGFAWLWHRPALGLTLLLLAFAALLGVILMIRKARAGARSSGGTPAAA